MLKFLIGLCMLNYCIANDINVSRVALNALLALQPNQRTVKNALLECAKVRTTQQQPLIMNCAWLVVTGRSQLLFINSTSQGPVEFLTCFDPTSQVCVYHPPENQLTVWADCMQCPACRFEGCASDQHGCQVACICACGQQEPAVIACHSLCNGTAQCVASNADEKPETCDLVRRSTPQPTSKSANAAAAGVAAAVLTLAALASFVGLFLFYKRRQAAGTGAATAGGLVDWCRLSSDDGDGDGEASIPLGESVAA